MPYYFLLAVWRLYSQFHKPHGTALPTSPLCLPPNPYNATNSPCTLLFFDYPQDAGHKILLKCQWKITNQHVPEECYIHQQCFGNLKSHNIDTNRKCVTFLYSLKPFILITAMLYPKPFSTCVTAKCFCSQSSCTISHLQMELVSSILETVFASIIRTDTAAWCIHIHTVAFRAHCPVHVRTLHHINTWQWRQICIYNNGYQLNFQWANNPKKTSFYGHHKSWKSYKEVY